MNPIEALNWRYAVKKFSDRKVTPQTLVEILEATRLSASSYGLQPYKVICIESQALRERLVPHSFGQTKVAESSHLIIIAAHRDVGDITVEKYIHRHAKTNNVAREDLNKFEAYMKSALSELEPNQRQEWAHQQSYIALGNLLTCAAMLEVDTCPMTGFDNAAYDDILGLINIGLTSSVICPIGYRHEGDAQAKAPKVRLDYDEFVVAM